MTATKTRKPAAAQKAAPSVWLDAGKADELITAARRADAGPPIWFAPADLDAFTAAAGQQADAAEAEHAAGCDASYQSVIPGEPRWSWYLSMSATDMHEDVSYFMPETRRSPLDPSGSEASAASTADADSGDPPSAAGPGPEGSPLGELDEDADGHMAAFLDAHDADMAAFLEAHDDATSETSAAGAGLGSPPAAETDAPGPEPSPGVPGPGAPDEVVPDFPDRDEHEPALDQDGAP